MWELMKKFDVVVDIRSASVNQDMGLIGLEMEGLEKEIDSARAWLQEIGVVVEPVELNVIE